MGKPFSLFTKILSAKAGAMKEKWSARKEKKGERIDKEFPLDIRIGSKLAINSTTLLLNKDVMLMDAFPKEMYVLYYGELTIASIKHHRFYLGEADEVEAVLQIVQNGNSMECRVFTTFDEVYPVADDEWDIFIGDHDQLIGSPIFTNNDHEVDYWRVWVEGDDWCRPMGYTETLYLDAVGEETLLIKHEAMLYSRPIDEKDETVCEYLLVSAEDRDEESVVHMMLGIAIDAASIKVSF